MFPSTATSGSGSRPGPIAVMTRSHGRCRLEVHRPELLHTDSGLLHDLMTATHPDEVILYPADGTATALDLRQEHDRDKWTDLLLNAGLRLIEDQLRARLGAGSRVTVRAVPAEKFHAFPAQPDQGVNR